jgi:hypothetical protein
MINTSEYIAPQQIEDLSIQYGRALAQAAEMLDLRANASPRTKAEMREAKALLARLKYADSVALIREDELAWALRIVKDTYATEMFGDRIGLFDKAAAMLGIDLGQHQVIPLDMQRKINNELQLVRSFAASSMMAQAASNQAA